MRGVANQWLIAGATLALCSLSLRPACGQNAAGSKDAASINTAQSGPVPVQAHPSAAEIVHRMLQKNQERSVALGHYESERVYRLQYTGTGGEHEAEIRVHAEYVAPDQKRLTVVSRSGSKLLCDKVLHRLVESEQEATAQSNKMQMTLGPENYDAELIGEETLPMVDTPIRTWVLRVTPKVNNKFTYRGTIWISQDDYALVKIQGEPARNPSWWVNRSKFESTYMRRGHVWLPAKITSSTHVRIGGEATLSIEYGTYPVLTQTELGPAAESAHNPSQAVALRP